MTHAARPLQARPRDRVDVRSGATTCAAWHYAGTNGACVVMATGLGLTRRSTDVFAARFNAEGFTVLAFDYRRFGDSGGEPRHVVRVDEQVQDLLAAADFAATLPRVDRGRVALWGFSLGGGHVIRAAAERDDVAAAVAQAPTADGRAAAVNAMRSATPGSLARLTAVALADATRGVFGGAPSLVPVAGARGSVAMLGTPDAMEWRQALDRGEIDAGSEPRVAARFALTSGRYRPVTAAGRVRCPLLVVAYDNDRSALPGPAIRAAERAPLGELVRRPGGHYAGFGSDLEETVAVELAFLRRHLLGASA